MLGLGLGNGYTQKAFSTAGGSLDEQTGRFTARTDGYFFCAAQVTLTLVLALTLALTLTLPHCNPNPDPDPNPTPNPGSPRRRLLQLHLPP